MQFAVAARLLGVALGLPAGRAAGRWVEKRTLMRAGIWWFFGVGMLPVVMRLGYFEITAIPPGLHAIDVDLLGYEKRSAPLRVLPAQTLEAEIRMSTKPIELPPLEVSIRSPRLEDAGFYQRRDEFGRQGRFITRDIIERRNPQVLSDLLYNQPGIRVDYIGAGQRRVFVNRNQGCQPMFYIDGALGDNRDVDVVRPETIEGVEIYIGANLPIQYKSMTDCGVIAVWTRRGRR
jgi:hypothetical protein